MRSLNKTKSSGPDGIHPRVYIELSDIIAAPLTTIFNSSIQQKSVPNDWKLAIVSPIFKKENRTTPSNYRPISLTCIGSKVMESFIRDHMLQHMKANDLLTRKQFGFLQGRSTVLQLLRWIDDWTDSLDQGIGVDAI